MGEIERCVRCGTDRAIEEDHIVPKKDWPLVNIRLGDDFRLSNVEVHGLVAAVGKVLDSSRNRRFLCKGCHDYRHAKEDAMEGLRKALARSQPAKVSMWIFRIGLIEANNTPELVRERGYRPYFDYPETHYLRWYPEMKSLAAERAGKEQRTL
jgi:hypothetical protein